ncbi:MAG: 50S ribosomal protein L3 N(5)-glutamine methyltransferase [Burkholderiaceae bacterium]|nr:50S ribosomal protein L3 N(5)-glutamine methyltransferase [Burkholderiaceae bacterium]
MTIGELIGCGEQLFIDAGIQFGQGTLSAWDESRWLTLATLGLPVDSPVSVERMPTTPKQEHDVRAIFQRRIEERLPAAYITGRAWLKGYEFIVDPRVIIPRSFIAELLIKGLKPYWLGHAPPESLLDMCTGSGCLAIIAAHQFPKATLSAVDISRDALAIAQENLQLHGLTGRIKLIESDCFAGMKDQNNTSFDVIISNPPYVPERKAAGLPPEFKAEPRLALIAADRGMAIVRSILIQAADFLTAQGLLLIEVGHERQACENMLNQEFPGITPRWVRTGEQFDNVFVLTRRQLIEHPWRPRR